MINLQTGLNGLLLSIIIGFIIYTWRNRKSNVDKRDDRFRDKLDEVEKETAKIPILDSKVKDHETRIRNCENVILTFPEMMKGLTSTLNSIKEHVTNIDQKVEKWSDRVFEHVINNNKK